MSPDPRLIGLALRRYIRIAVVDEKLKNCFCSPKPRPISLLRGGALYLAHKGA